MTRSPDRILAATMAEPHFMPRGSAWPVQAEHRVTYLTAAIKTAIQLLEMGWSSEGVLTYLRETDARANREQGQ